MKQVLSSTALIVALSAPAFADQHTGQQGAGMFVTTPEESVLRASELVGARLYVTEEQVSDMQGGMNDNWNDAGEISEIAMGQDGQVDFIVADIGGFLGIGEKRVAVPLDQLQFVSDGEGADDWFIVLTAAQADLENAPEFEGFDSADAERNAGQDGQQMQQNGSETAQSGTQGDGSNQTERETAQGGATLAPENEGEATRQADSGMTGTGQEQGMNQDGYTTVDVTTLTADDLTGLRVYDGSGEFVGDVGELILADDGTSIERVVIDVGGFLGIGEKPVAISIDDMQLQREGDGGALRVTVPMTEEELESQPRHEG